LFAPTAKVIVDRVFPQAFHHVNLQIQLEMDVEAVAASTVQIQTMAVHHYPMPWSVGCCGPRYWATEVAEGKRDGMVHMLHLLDYTLMAMLGATVQT
jgi:hypothetical protein